MTPKTSGGERQPRAVAPALVAVAVLALVSIGGLSVHQDSATFNNAAFAVFHICVLMTGCWPALRRTGTTAPTLPSPASAIGLRAS